MIRCWTLSFIFLSLVFLLPYPAFSLEAEKVSSLQFVIGKGTNILGKPEVTWTGRNGEILLIDKTKIFFWKKKKIFQIVEQADGEALPLSFSPAGEMFVCAPADSAVLGSSDTLDFRSLNEKIDTGDLVWSQNGSLLYFLKNRSLFRFDVRQQRLNKLWDNVKSFFESSDAARIVFEEWGSGSRDLINSDKSGRVRLPQNSIHLEKRAPVSFIRNMSPDFRRIIVEKPGEKGSVIYKIDWNNELVSPVNVLEDFTGSRDAAFSPDGSKIAMTVKDESGKSYMAVLTSAGDIVVKFSLKPGWVYRDPLWSPSGKWVLWNYIDAGMQEEDKSRFFITDVRGVSVQFVPGLLSPSELYWSPDGDRLLVREQERGLQSGGYVVYDLRKKLMKQLFKDKKGRATSPPVWSPDGRYVVIIDYSTYQKREKRSVEVKGVQKEIEFVFFREQVFLYDSDEDAMQLLW